MGTRRGGGTRYQMRQKMVAIGDDFWIENDQGQKIFKVDGKALRVRDTLRFENVHGNELCKIQERMLRVKDSMEIEHLTTGAAGGLSVHAQRALGLEPGCFGPSSLGDRVLRSQIRIPGRCQDQTKWRLAEAGAHRHGGVARRKSR